MDTYRQLEWRLQEEQRLQHKAFCEKKRENSFYTRQLIFDNHHRLRDDYSFTLTCLICCLLRDQEKASMGEIENVNDSAHFDFQNYV